MQRTQARIVDVELNDIHDVDAYKGEFVEMEPSYLTNLFKDLVTEEGYELGAEFDLGETHGADYYAERNPGFPDDWYEILAEEHKLLNKEYKDNSILCITNDVSNGHTEPADIANRKWKEAHRGHHQLISKKSNQKWNSWYQIRRQFLNILIE